MTAPGKPRNPSRPSSPNLYTIALCVSFVVCIAQMVSLPVLVTFDGYWYARLAEVIGTARFAKEWDYLRTPLFPILLKLSFWLFGRTPLALIALQSAMGFGGIWLLGATLRRWGRTTEAAVTVVLLSAFPTLITYEHALLTEAGTFFFLALLLYVVTAPVVRPGRRALELAGVLALGYYHRSSLLYIAPVVAAVYALSVYQQCATAGPVRGRALRRLLGGTMAVALLPFALAYPWERNPQVAERQKDVLLYGLVKQAVIADDDPAWGAAAPAYREAIERSLINGRLPLSGVQDQLVYPPLDALVARVPQAGHLLIRVVLHNPKRYLGAVLRMSLLFAGLEASATDSQNLRTAVLLSSDTRIAPRPPGFPPLDTEMAQLTGRSPVGRVQALVAPVYDLLCFFAAIATLILLGVGLHRRDPGLLALTGIPISFLLLNALLLTSQDRMAAPAYPLMLANLVLLPGWLRPRLSVATWQTHRSFERADRYAFRAFVALVLLLASCHTIYLLRSAMIPSSDEAHYMSGVFAIAQGLRSGSLKTALLSYASALGFKAPLICVPAAFLSLVVGDTILASMLSLVLVFIGVGLAAYSLFRNLFQPTLAAFAAALLVTAPVVTGLTHRFYVENLLLLITLLYLNLLNRLDLKRVWTVLFLGVLAGLGLLAKTLFAVLVFPPTLYAAYLCFREGAIGYRGIARAAGLFISRLSILGATAGAVALTWYGFHWKSAVGLGRALIVCAECDYPVARAFLADFSSGPYLMVSLVAILGILPLAEFLAREKAVSKSSRMWVSVLLTAIALLLATAVSPAKSVRYIAMILPAVSALAVFSAIHWFRRDTRLLIFLSALTAASFALVIQNSFEVLPIGSVRLGDLRVLDSRYPLNSPDWFDDNHPVDRRDFRVDEAGALFSRDVLSRYPPGSQATVGLLVHGLLINHDYLNLLAQMRGQPVHYNPFYLTDLTGAGAPDYILTCLGCGRVYPGRHYHDPHPDFVRQVREHLLPYQEIFELEAPAGCRLLGFRRTELQAEEISMAGLARLTATTNSYIDTVNDVTGPSGDPITVTRQWPLRITGWAVDLPNRGPAGGVFIEIDGQVFRAQYGAPRPDVAEALGSSAYAATGFAAIIPMAHFKAGSHSLFIDILNSSQTGYYRAKELLLSVR
jgi:hypothetical protein